MEAATTNTFKKRNNNNNGGTATRIDIVVDYQWTINDEVEIKIANHHNEIIVDSVYESI